MRELERICLLKCVDRQWMDHIDNMDQLRQGIALRGYGQKDPVVEYRIEGFDMFDQMVDHPRGRAVNAADHRDPPGRCRPQAGAGCQAHRRGLCARQRCPPVKGAP